MPSLSPRLALLCSCAALALAVPACGGDDEGGGGGEPGGAAAESGSGTDAVKVGMEDIEYVPRDVTVKQGGTVTWTNSDSVTHTVTKEGGPGPEFDSGNLNVDDTFEQKFDAAGKVDYVCTIHPNQTGTVTVE